MAQFGNTRGRGGGSRGGRGGGRGGRGGMNGPKLPAELRDKVDGGKSGNYKKDKDFRRQKPDRDFGQDRDQETRSERKPRVEERDVQAGPSRIPYKSTTKPTKPVPAAVAGKKKAVVEEAPPKKKKKELRLPNAPTDDKEDGEIEWLEWTLRNEKGKGKEEESDGLDDLLDFADRIGPGGKGLKRDRDEDDSEDDDDDLDLDLNLSEEETDDDEDDEDADGDSTVNDLDPEDLLDDEPSDLDEADNGSEGEIDLSENEATLVKDDEEEATAAPTKYVPPHMRAAQLAAKAQGSKEKALSKQKLERKLQGLLNKLSEANMDSIIGGIEEVYRDNSRNVVTTAITDLVLLAVSSKANLLDSFVSLYAVFIGALHRIIGVEFGAHFLHTLVMRYKNPSSNPAPAATIYETPDASKESLNLLTLVAELYNVGVVGPKLIYDLIREFIDHGLNETDVEGLLKLVKRSQLRSEDPGSLKDITNLVLDKTKGQDMTVRTKFMLETLTSLKSAKKEPNRFLSSLGKKRRLLTNEPLRVTLNDLLQSDTRGKWWLVGAGWQGNPLLEVKPIEKQEDSILEMAREQGMNTDVRRSIFVILMTSEDFVHACDRMNALKYTETQQREYVRVTLHCCNLEKSYNPYYTLVLNNLCSESYSHRFTLQYALWDLLREGAGTNVAKTMAYIIARGSMDLTVFKAIDFTTLKKNMIAFFKTLLPSVILATQTTSPLFVLSKQQYDKEVIQDVFEKSLANPELAQGLAYVITRYGAKMGEGLDERQAAVVKKGLEAGKKVLARSL